MNVFIVGAGKLANELASSLRLQDGCHVAFWKDRDRANGQSVVVHAGSGRELEDVASFCAETRSALVELATGSAIEAMAPQFPVVLCVNTNVLVLKVLAMLARSGHMFKDCKVSLVESHQAQKSSAPGTALSMARSLGIQSGAVRSIRDVIEQELILKIPPEHLGRHAYHQIRIEDAGCAVTLETRVYGASPYAEGVARIISAIGTHALENRCYDIVEFIENDWL